MKIEITPSLLKREFHAGDCATSNEWLSKALTNPTFHQEKESMLLKRRDQSQPKEANTQNILPFSSYSPVLSQGL